ncbi:sensor histidine kinase [Flavobacterium sp. MC2016-06]|uniref:sensor histidine kinase n=1 Tax=Flavobacterium sp. MC2016-06 TaxID=2676308 RepID=UPI0012BB1D1A|nr:sensor histidine kinase [Flavobacterium sp. MC2016-06]MBU3860322.1 sensor histidine kinase [Flavobacterium sp. MC2016-06]
MKRSALLRYFILAFFIVSHTYILNAQKSQYTDSQLKKIEGSLTELPGNSDKIETLLKLSDWYEENYYKAKELQKAFDYANEALLLSQNLHSDIYAGKCYLQLSMLYQLSNDYVMLESSARKAIALLAKTNHRDDLAESWVMIWSAKMLTKAPEKERLVPIYNALALFKSTGNNERICDCYKEISEIYLSFRDFPNARINLEKAMLFYKKSNLQKKRFSPVYDDVINLRSKTYLQQNELKSAAFLRNSMIIFLVLLIIILGLLYKSFKFKKKTNNVLEIQQNLITQKNTTLENLVAEKEWLLREIHHRVKNNLHMVVGLLASQIEYLKNEQAIEAINDSQNRIHTMSLIHQKLYQSENLSIINMPSYLFELAEYLKDSYNIEKSIHFSLDIDNFDLPLSHSIPIGLIFNEAVTNSIKYAFPNSKNGKINIALKQKDDHKYVLTFQDNGIGLAPEFDPYNNPSLGIKLMYGLSDDINGKFTIMNENGTKICLEFTFNDSKS